MKDFLRDENLRYCVEYDCHTSNDNCQCDSICRCSVITQTKVTDASRVVPSIMGELPKKMSAIHRYAIGRICTFCELWRTDLYDVEVGNGYYGQEVTGISIDPAVRKRFEELVGQFTELKDPTEITLELLREEYGFILNCVKNAKFSIKPVEVLTINCGQDNHYRRV